MTFNYITEIPEILSIYLSEEVIQKFRQIIFGPLLDAGVVYGQAQVVSFQIHVFCNIFT